MSFSGSTCYVNPIDTIPQGQYVKAFYYVNGTLQIKNPTGLTVLTGKQRRVQNDELILYSSDARGGVTHRHPIVKIGSLFWTRHDIDHQMYFAEKASAPSMDQIYDDVLYAQFQWSPNNEFLAYNGWTWGYKPNTFFEGNPNMSWFLPTPAQVKELNAYLDFNPKALFKGQVSGFNAQFSGYYGWSDIMNQNKYFAGRQREIRYKGELNVISSSNAKSYADACLMVLKPDYTIQQIDDTTNRTVYRMEWRNNFYPVRAVRGWMYEYPTWTTITKNLR